MLISTVDDVTLTYPAPAHLLVSQTYACNDHAAARLVPFEHVTVPDGSHVDWQGCQCCMCNAGPGGDGLQGFWEKASGQADIPSLIPHERWAIERAYAPEVTVEKMYVRFAGFLPSMEAFDANAFR